MLRAPTGRVCEFINFDHADTTATGLDDTFGVLLLHSVIRPSGVNSVPRLLCCSVVGLFPSLLLRGITNVSSPLSHTGTLHALSCLSATYFAGMQCRGGSVRHLVRHRTALPMYNIGCAPPILFLRGGIVRQPGTRLPVKTNYRGTTGKRGSLVWS